MDAQASAADRAGSRRAGGARLGPGAASSGRRGSRAWRISALLADDASHRARSRRPFLMACWKESVNMAKNTICLWYERDAEAAARFYAKTFPQSSVGAVHRAPADYPDGKAGDVLTVDFMVAGIPCVGLNGGPHYRHSEAFSFQIATDDQEETDRYWNAIVGNGGQESQCGWCKDKWGVSWQITPRVLTDAMAKGGDAAKRAFEAMMPMKKIDVATIEAAVRG